MGQQHQVLVAGKDQKIIYIEGFPVDEIGFKSRPNDEYLIRNEIENKYKQRFIDEYWKSDKNSLYDLFANQLNSLDPDTLLTLILNRHPWLAEEIEQVSRQKYTQDYTVTLVYRFLQSVINEALIDLQPPHNQTAWQ